MSETTITEDERVFGRDAWVYCSQHRKPHQTGWCTVGVRDKMGLGVVSAVEAYEKCREMGLPIHGEARPDPCASLKAERDAYNAERDALAARLARLEEAAETVYGEVFGGGFYDADSAYATALRAALEAPK